MFQRIPLPACVCDLASGALVEANAAFVELFGAPRAQLLGTQPPGHRTSAVEETLPVVVTTATGPRALRRCQRAFQIAGVPHLLVTYTELSDGDRIAAAAHLDPEEMRAFAAGTHEVFWLMQRDGKKLTLISPAYERVFGRSAEALYRDPRDWLHAIHAEDRDRVLAFARQPVTQPRRTQARVVHPDGSIRTLEATLFPIRDAAGVVTRIGGAAEDVTERLQLEAQVRQTQKLESLGLLAGGVAHDFNNLLAVISANASLLDDAIAEAQPEHELVAEIEAAVARAAWLTHQLLAFSRKSAVSPVSVDLNEVVDDTRKMLRRLVGEDVVIATSLEPELQRVRIDPGSLVQVLMNLAVNARDAMPRGGELTLTTRTLEERRQVMLAVSDTGCGMSAEVRARVFEPFFTTKGVGQGTGLGLSVVHGIVEQARGHIEIDSVAGVGTTFRIYLPIDVGTDHASPAPAAPRTSGSETVLLVDDDAYVRRALARMLHARGYHVLEAASGAAALDLLGARGESIQLLVTDVVMPGMDGRQLAQAALRRWPGLQVLYISGYTDDALVHHGMEPHAAGVLQKPFRGHDLAGRVRAVLDAAQSAA